ncbi:RNA polymerase sigma factor [Phenylobacterium sp. CCH12-B4]|uniref:RNA polymerase sigma factor n=1 Tax=Phenylobacterium sp. CCH12-B4 TaxID=1768784 RepID=UPI001E511A6E|nr:sigma factor [Phenylobacterium sp. CCH12-B4]
MESSPEGADTCRDVEGLARRLAAERPRQLRYLRSRLPTAEDAEDAWQDASIRFLQHAASLAAAERPEAWMGVSLRRLVVDRYRRAAVQRRTAEALAAEPLPQPLADPEAEVELQAAAVRLHRARAALRAAMDENCHACPLADCWAKARLRNIAA